MNSNAAPRGGLANRIMYDGLYTFVMRLLNIGCAAALGIVTARMLGPAGKGLYALPGIEAGLVVSAFSGLGSATSYFLLNRRAGRRLVRTAFLVGLALFAAGAAAIVPIALFSGQRWALLPAIVSLLPAAAINLAAGYAIGIKRVRYSTAINVCVTAVTLLLMVVGFLFVGRSAAVAIAMWIGGSAVVAVVALAGVLWHSRKLQGGDSIGTVEFGKFAMKVGLVNLISLLNYRADLYIVALLTTAAQLGLYTVAVSAAESLLVPTQVSALVTSPHIASVDRESAARLTARCVRNNLIVALAVCGLLFAFALPIVEALYGRAFAGVVPALRVLLLGVVALSLGSPMSSYFTLKLGRPEVALWLASSSAVICIAASVILIPQIGMIGAAAGSTAGYAAAQAAAILYFSRLTKTPLRVILIPSAEDWALYRAFLSRILADGRQLLHPASR